MMVGRGVQGRREGAAGEGSQQPVWPELGRLYFYLYINCDSDIRDFDKSVQL